MAIGAALLFNIKLPINFNSPYKSLDIQDFWRRWHITLSRFLRDYVYIQLGGNKQGSFRTYNNLLATFILGGLWHGAGWTFIFWGFLHGMALVIHRLWKQFSFIMNRYLAWFITFNFVNIAWIFFRAKEWEDAIKVLSGMFDFENIEIDITNKILGGVLIGIILVVFLKNTTENIEKFKLNLISLLIGVMAFVIAFLHLNKISEFLYFNF